MIQNNPYFVPKKLKFPWENKVPPPSAMLLNKTGRTTEIMASGKTPASKTLSVNLTCDYADVFVAFISADKGLQCIPKNKQPFQLALKGRCSELFNSFGQPGLGM